MGRKHRHKQAKRSAQVIKLVPKVEPVVAHDVAPCEPQAGYPSSHELKSFGLRMRPEAQGRRAQSALTPATGPMDLQTFQRVFAPAKPPPGVLPAGTKPMAMDDAFPNPFGIAAIANFTENLAWLGYPYLSELAQRPEYRRISETIAREMTRKWIKFQASGNEDKTWKLDAIEAEFKRHQVKDKFRRLAELDGFFGGGHLYIDTGFTENPEELKLPLVVHRSKIRIGGLKLLHVVEPVWTYPGMYNAINPLRADFYKPSQWYVMGQTVHTTRLLPFISRPMPDLLKPAYSFRGLSMSQMAKPYVDNWLRTRQSISDLIHSFSVSGVKTNLMGVLNGGGGEEETTRANMFINMRDNNGVMMLDKETEEWFNVSTPLSTLDHLQAQSQEHMCSVSGIPLVIFTGITPSGLNASSEEEIAVWNTWIEATQEHLFREHLMTLLRIVQLSLFGEIDPEIDFKFVPLAEPTAKEEAEIELAKAQVDAAYINIGVIGPNEARERLAADEDSPYDGLEIDMPMPGMIDPVTGLPIEQDPLAAGGQVVDNGQQPQAVSQNEPPMQQPRGGAVSNQYPLGQAHDAAWNEGKHPRGQPENAGEFAPVAGGGASENTSEGESRYWESANAVDPQLDDNEAQVIQNYTYENYPINAALRSGDNLEHFGLNIESLDSIIGKGVLKPGTQIYRWVPKKDVSEWFGRQIRRGDIVEDKAYLFTSKDAEHKDLTNPAYVRFLIVAGENTRGLDIERYAAHPFEHEVLLPRSSKLRVKAIHKKGKGVTIECEVI